MCPSSSFAHRGRTLRNGSLPREKEGCREPALRGRREAPSSSGRRWRCPARRTRRSVSIAPPKAGSSEPGRSSIVCSHSVRLKLWPDRWADARSEFEYHVGCDVGHRFSNPFRRAQTYSLDAERLGPEPHIRSETVRFPAPEPPILRHWSQLASNEVIVRDILAVGQSTSKIPESRDDPSDEKRHHC